MGLLIVTAPVTNGLKEEADKSGSYISTMTGASYPKIQIVTVAEQLAHKRPKLPEAILPYVTAKPYDGEQLTML